MTYDDWFHYVSIGYLCLLIAAAVVAIVLWRLNDAYELGAANRPKRVYANAAVLSLGMIGAFASVVLFFLSQRANQEAARRTAQAQETAESAKSRAARAVRQAARAKRQAAAARQRTEAEAIERLKLEKEFGWRRIDTANLDQAIEKLSRHKTKVNLLILAGDAEAMYYGLQLLYMFQKAGWEEVVSFQTVVGEILRPLTIKSVDNSEGKAAKQAMEAVGVTVSIGAMPRAYMSLGDPDPAASVDIFVGPHIPTDFEAALSRK